jgi:transcriptional regulator with XRE-family HTH domain
VSYHAVGEFLRARRDQIRPEDAGLVNNGRRRVPGLRRDELAMLAGISTEYYTRLEQGRDHHPSEQVLDAVARALSLDEDGRAHLHRLAAAPDRRRTSPRRPAQARASVRQLIDSWTTTPAYVQSRHLDVIASNALAQALSPMFAPGSNLLRAIFLDARAQDLLPDWKVKVQSLVASLRANIGADTDDPRLTELVGELSVKSPEFVRLWSRHDARCPAGDGTHLMFHPDVGQLELHYDKFTVTAADCQTLVTYHAIRGSSTEQALILLSTLARTPRDPRISEGGDSMSASSLRAPE